MSISQVVIRQAAGDADYAAFGDLCRAYVHWCRARYADMPWFVEEVFGHQFLEAELLTLREKYGPPKGRTLIAWRGGVALGGGATWRTLEQTCELKRLFVTDEARGLGLGRRLTEALIDAARADGSTMMQLDTGDRLTEATGLYERMGFRFVDPYLPYPERLLKHLVFMERAIAPN